MKNVLILTPFFSPNTGGAETFTDELIKEVNKCHNITVLTFQPFNQKAPVMEMEYRHHGTFLKIFRMNWWVKQSKAWQGVSIRNMFSVIPQMVLRSLSLCIKNHYDIIHAQGLLSGYIAVSLRRIHKAKVFITLLAIYDFKKWDKGSLKYQIVEWTLKNSDIIFVEGKNGKKDIEELVDESKIRIFQHWCDQNLFRPPVSRPADKIRVLFVGRPTFEKGKHIIEDAEAILNNPKYEFLYVENIPYAELPKIYQMAHICVVPSLYSEGFARVVAESASCGCAVITSNKGSLKEMTNEFGYAIEPTPINFVEHIEVYDNEDNETSYKYAKENFNSKNATVFLKEYENANN